MGGVETSPFTRHSSYLSLLLPSFGSLLFLINKKKKAIMIFKLQNWWRENAITFHSSPMRLLLKVYLCSIKKLSWIRRKKSETHLQKLEVIALLLKGGFYFCFIPMRWEWMASRFPFLKYWIFCVQLSIESVIRLSFIWAAENSTAVTSLLCFPN